MVERLQVETQVSANPTLEEQAAALDAKAAQSASTEEKPAAGKILGKFEDQSALETGYSELERRNTQLAQELAELKKGKAPEAKADEKPAGDTPDPSKATEEQAREVAENAGVDFDALSASYAEKGELSADEYAKLEKAGIPKAMVDSFIAGQEALAEQVETKAYAAVGGQEQYDAMAKWAEGALSEDEKKLFNVEANSGNEQRVLFAVNNLKARWQQAEGREPSRQLNGGAMANATDVFESWNQVSAAMRDPRYGKDPAYTNSVAAKVGRSKL